MTVLALVFSALALVLFLIASFDTPKSNGARAHLVPLGLTALTAALMAQLLGLTPLVA